MLFKIMRTYSIMLSNLALVLSKPFVFVCIVYSHVHTHTHMLCVLQFIEIFVELTPAINILHYHKYAFAELWNLVSTIMELTFVEIIDF